MDCIRGAAALALLGIIGCTEPAAPVEGGSGTEGTTGSGTTTGASSVDSTGSGSGPTSGASGDAGSTGEAETTAGMPDVGVPACALDSAFPEPEVEHTLEHDGMERRFIVHVPTAYDHRAPTPVVFAFHGYTNTPQQQEEWSMMSAKAEEAGFILVYAYGTGVPSSWNGGDCCGAGVTDDVGFVSAMIDWLDGELCIDVDRVYATGFSNGGFLSHRLACELSDRIAAIGPVAGMLGIDDCMPDRPMPVLQLHGTSDFIVPFDGSVGLGFRSAEETIAQWVEIDGCVGDPVVTYEQGDVTCESYQDCDAQVEVELCTVTGGGHTWPGGADIFGAGPTTQDIDANDHIWEFFERHPRP